MLVDLVQDAFLLGCGVERTSRVWKAGSSRTGLVKMSQALVLLEKKTQFLTLLKALILLGLVVLYEEQLIEEGTSRVSNLPQPAVCPGQSRSS